MGISKIILKQAITDNYKKKKDSVIKSFGLQYFQGDFLIKKVEYLGCFGISEWKIRKNKIFQSAKFCGGLLISV